MEPSVRSLLLLMPAALAQVAYEYDQSLVAKDKKHGGQRLVGADSASHQRMPFLVALTMADDGSNLADCTGSLITPTWVISATHCDEYLPEKTDLEKCIDATNQGATFSPPLPPDAPPNTTSPVYRCCRIVDNNLEIYPIKPQALAWLGANNLHTDGSRDYQTLVVKRIVRHDKRYRGGGTYGTYGGYDITLLELDGPVAPPHGMPACLPTPTFRDTGIKANLAGYGQFYRRGRSDYMKARCQTDEYGRNKFHMCREEGQGEEICHMDRPAPQDPACSAFFNQTHQAFPEQYEEIHLVEENSNNSIFCFPSASPRPRSRGWCETNETFYGLRMAPEAGWGFCGPDCFLGNISREKENSILRQVVAVDVLPDEACDAFLNKSIGPGGLEVMPLILCIGHYKPWRTQVWKKLGGEYKKLEDNSEEKKKYKHFGDQLGFPAIQGYVTSAGTCSGDSGGPAYVEEDAKFIVLGVVSGGRGRIGSCGGINNPVHYARLSRFAPWIVKILGKDAKALCWHKKFEEKRHKEKHRKQWRQRRI